MYNSGLRMALIFEATSAAQGEIWGQLPRLRMNAASLRFCKLIW